MEVAFAVNNVCVCVSTHHLHRLPVVGLPLVEAQFINH